MASCEQRVSLFFFNDTATTEIYTLSLHDALPIYGVGQAVAVAVGAGQGDGRGRVLGGADRLGGGRRGVDRKSTRLNSSHANISDAVLCLKKNKKKDQHWTYVHRAVDHYTIRLC